MRLKREVAKLKAERDILKKQPRPTPRRNQKREVLFIAKHRGIPAVDWMCEALGVSRVASSYAWLTRPRSQRSRKR